MFLLTSHDMVALILPRCSERNALAAYCEATFIIVRNASRWYRVEQLQLELDMVQLVRKGLIVWRLQTYIQW